MNRIQLLINALRSGEFIQGRTRLHRRFPNGVDNFCCLGVACELYRRETGKGEWHHNDQLDCEGMRFDHTKNDIDAVSYMPQPVYAWYGFPSGDPFLTVETGWKYTATEMNDKYGFTFDKIADAFERTFITNETKQGTDPTPR